MDEIPDVYEIENSEQLRVAADPMRQRIIHPLTLQPMTVTQVGNMLGVAPAKAHYHVRELERVGLVKLVETREKGGILEKYYRAAGKNLVLPPTLLPTMRQEHVALVGEFLQGIAREFMRAVSQAREDDRPAGLTLGRSQFWATDEEADALARQIESLFEPYGAPRGVEGEGERTFVEVLYRAPPDASDIDDSEAPEKRRSVMVVGATTYNRTELERTIARREKLDIAVVGYCRFAPDVTADLIEKAVNSFRHRGILQASDSVLDALKRKEQPPD